MRKYIFLILLFSITFSPQNANAQFVDIKETKAIAQNWIQMKIDKYGDWGGSKTATAGEMQELRYFGKLVGYYCKVRPRGYIVVSLRRELAAVKAYSDRSNIDFSREEGMPDLIKYRLFRIIKNIEAKAGPIQSADIDQVENLLEFSYKSSWTTLENYTPGSFSGTPVTKQNYQEGDSLLDTHWQQRVPYNSFCPFPGGDSLCSNTSNGRTLVGCVAIAGAQLMKYWNWPPYGESGIYDDPYECALMGDSVTTSFPIEEQYAVAELCFEVGQAVGMNYGCNVSTAWGSSMEGALESIFRYNHNCNTINRTDYTADEWFNQIIIQINDNRPILYYVGRIGESVGHAIVCDGWQIMDPPFYLKMYHMNFGWDNNTTGFYTIDQIMDYDSLLDHMTLDIVPDYAVGTQMIGTYDRTSFAYRYFDQDTQGALATFSPGQSLQILPEVTITGTGTDTNIRIEGALGLSTQIFADGDPSDGIHIYNGAIQFRNGGSIKLKEIKDE